MKALSNNEIIRLRGPLSKCETFLCTLSATDCIKRKISYFRLSAAKEKVTHIRAKKLDNKSCEGLHLQRCHRFTTKLGKPIGTTPDFSQLFMELRA